VSPRALRYGLLFSVLAWAVIAAGTYLILR
jgi:hypothetical protein